MSMLAQLLMLTIERTQWEDWLLSEAATKRAFWIAQAIIAGEYDPVYESDL